MTTRTINAACALTLGMVLAAVTAASIATVGFREMSTFSNPDNRHLLLAAISIVILAVTGTFTFFLLQKFGELYSWAENHSCCKRIRLSFNARSIAVASVIIFVCWIPWILLQFPCSMNGDTYNQLYQFQTSFPTLYSTINTTVNESFVDHHPVFDTLIFGAFLTVGDALGSQNLGLFAYSLFQCALTAIGLGITSCYLETLEVPKLFRIVSLLFCALFPPIPLWATCMLKDSLFSAIYIYYCLLVVEAVRTKGRLFSSAQKVVLYIGVASLCILTKKSGVLVVSISTLALLLYARSYWKSIALNFAIPLVFCLILVPMALYPAIGGVAAGGKQEMFGFAFQQVITAINDNDDLTDQERESVSKVLNIERARDRYKPNIVDPVKNSAVNSADTADYLDFLPAYFSIGTRHISSYTSSIFNVVGTLVAPGRTFTYFSTPEQTDDWKATFEKADSKHELHLNFNKPEPIASAAATVEKAWRVSIPKLGPFQVFFNVGFYGGWIPIICLIICLFKNKRWAIALIPAAVSLAIIVIGPASSVRYALPMLYTTPLMLGVLCTALQHSENQRRAS